MILKDYIKNQYEHLNISGANDSFLGLYRLLDVDVKISNNDIYITSSDFSNEELCVKIISFISRITIKTDNEINLHTRDIIYIINCFKNNIDEYELESFYLNPLTIFHKNTNGKTIYAKTINQVKFINEVNKNDITFSIGPAGTGKTFLAVCYAVNGLRNNTFKKIILTRPAIEAGEQLGFLPGDLKEKIDPYLIPLYDFIELLLGKTQMDNLIEKGVIEIAPLAFLRGRTIDNSIVILDEAQNATYTQLKMFTTRLGFNSKMIITGDPSQIDLIAKNAKNGSSLLSIDKIYSNIDGVKIIYFDASDVVRHPIIGKIINRYNEYENNNS